MLRRRHPHSSWRGSSQSARHKLAVFTEVEMQAREGAVCQAQFELCDASKQSEGSAILSSHAQPALWVPQILLDDALVMCWHDQSYCCLCNKKHTAACFIPCPSLQGISNLCEFIVTVTTKGVTALGGTPCRMEVAYLISKHCYKAIHCRTRGSFGKSWANGHMR